MKQLTQLHGRRVRNPMRQRDWAGMVSPHSTARVEVMQAIKQVKYKY